MYAILPVLAEARVLLTVHAFARVALLDLNVTSAHQASLGHLVQPALVDQIQHAVMMAYRGVVFAIVQMDSLGLLVRLVCLDITANYANPAIAEDMVPVMR